MRGRRFDIQSEKHPLGWQSTKKNPSGGHTPEVKHCGESCPTAQIETKLAMSYITTTSPLGRENKVKPRLVSGQPRKTLEKRGQSKATEGVRPTAKDPRKKMAK